MMPNLVVLIPYYNSLEDLRKTLSSIDEKQHLDILIIDDGSSKELKLKDIGHSFAFGQILIDGYRTNKGIEFALNLGLKIAQEKGYSYIARLDCGDTCNKNRFYKQREYLETHKNIDLIGSWVNVMNDNDEILYTHQLPITHDEIKKKMYLNAMFIHPAICFRSSLLDDIGLYPTEYKTAEDYAFFFKVIKNHNTANIPEPLVNILTTDHGISGSARKKQVKTRIKLIRENFYFGFFPIYGLLRNYALLMISRKQSTAIKKLLYQR